MGKIRETVENGPAHVAVAFGRQVSSQNLTGVGFIDHGNRTQDGAPVFGQGLGEPCLQARQDLAVQGEVLFGLEGVGQSAEGKERGRAKIRIDLRAASFAVVPECFDRLPLGRVQAPKRHQGADAVLHAEALARRDLVQDVLALGISGELEGEEQPGTRGHRCVMKHRRHVSGKLRYLEQEFGQDIQLANIGELSLAKAEEEKSLSTSALCPPHGAVLRLQVRRPEPALQRRPVVPPDEPQDPERDPARATR